jgi:Zn-dependent protease
MTQQPRYGQNAPIPPMGSGAVTPIRRPRRWAPSPIFVGLLVVTIASGAALWNSLGDRGIVAFIFVATSWVVTLCLHEFAHAIVAYRNGDESVAHRGYLTLDPLKYTHVVLSLVLPLLFLLLGGIGLPGGAVFIDRRALRTRFAHSAVSAAGPLTNLAVAIVLSTAIFIWQDSHVFWAALAFLAFLQVTAAIINLLPLPGLDGYGVIEPYLPRSWAAQAAKIAPYAFFGLFALLLIPAVNRAFFGGIYWLMNLLGVPPILIGTGYDLFQFWM